MNWILYDVANDRWISRCVGDYPEFTRTRRNALCLTALARGGRV